MGTPAQVVPGYYVWQVPGNPVVIHLNLNVVDRLAAEMMRGYGALPKRGAEVGGVLIGTTEEVRSERARSEQAQDEAVAGEKSHIVKVEDFLAALCEHRRGPSYLFTEEDGTAFELAFEQPGVIGYFRSHTRDGLSLAEDDIELLDHFFPGPAHPALLVKPSATNACTAGFFVRENGAFPAEPALEFPFRRNELIGEAPPPRRALTDRGPRNRGQGRRERQAPNGSSANRSAAPASDYRSAPNDSPPDAFPAGDDPAPEHALPKYRPGEFTPNRRPDPPASRYAHTSPAKARSKNWYWFPLSFVFLLLGLFLGFQIALSVGSHIGSSGVADFSLNLSAAKSGDNLNVKWNPQSPAVRAAERGTLEIVDGTKTKRVELDAAQLQSGGLIYRGSSNLIRFRLTVYPGGRVSVSEAIEWK